MHPSRCFGACGEVSVRPRLRLMKLLASRCCVGIIKISPILLQRTTGVVERTFKILRRVTSHSAGFSPSSNPPLQLLVLSTEESIHVLRFDIRSGGDTDSAVITYIQTNDLLEGIRTEPSQIIQPKEEGEHNRCRPSDNKKGPDKLATQEVEVTTSSSPLVEPSNMFRVSVRVLHMLRSSK